MKIKWREDMVNPVPLVSCQLQCQFRKLRQTLKQHQHLWFANPLNRRDQAPWGFSMNFHEFPQPKPIILSDPTFLEGWIFFFRPQHNIPCSSCQAIFLRCLSEWLPEGEGRERMDSYPGQNLPRYLGLFIFCTFQVGVAQLKLFLIYSVFEGNDWW